MSLASAVTIIVESKRVATVSSKSSIAIIIMEFIRCNLLKGGDY